ncbi:vitamin K epoxide reductase family protein [Lysinibacillus pakistanensis]|uniref:Vitamin K epoxide reductase family protein n=1 Tax=Lysinibacillus pakistanensis TaxID=759811 RepID=A0AAX3WVB4_9BACI|nr:vitamin K epoxide reductase family protein [Lysinibacillus pakistanensis]MDM5230067.1 vitamin K epoxide reductase family protein [Lysinibacillus pakistanensis]WHY45665.1 vitamin K epoxide reductase family protein [Lysinibacillus pakistanensis]WHY50673.1 vitamin K epoxide reductase family protein [Lysinibacillus pakistanensis]
MKPNLRISFFIIGLLISLYLLVSYSVYKGILICPNDGCDEVAMSPYSKIIGIPVPLIGVFGYLALINLSIFKIERFLTMTLILAFLFSSYLMIISIFIIKTLCFWCLLSFLIILITLLLQVKDKIKRINKKGFIDEQIS